MRWSAPGEGRHGVFATKRTIASVRPASRSATSPSAISKPLCGSRTTRPVALAWPSKRGSAPVPETATFAARRPPSFASGPSHAASASRSGISATTLPATGASRANSHPLVPLTMRPLPSPWMWPMRLPTTFTVPLARPRTDSACSVSSVRPSGSGGSPTRRSPDTRFTLRVPSKVSDE